MNQNKAAKKYALVVGIDRSDKSLSVCELRNGRPEPAHTISTDPAKLLAWWEELRQNTRGTIAVAFEQPAINLLNFFENTNAVVFGLNPGSTWGYRQSLRVSRARTDESDAEHIALFVARHHDQLRSYNYGSSEVRQIKAYTMSRRHAVDQRTKLTNRMQELLKRYFPQSILLMHEEIHRPMNLDLLDQWPTPQSLIEASERCVSEFFYSHGSRSQKRAKERLDIIRELTPLTDNPAIIDPCSWEVKCICQQVRLLNEQILQYDRKIRGLMANQQQAQLFFDLPGAGKALAPRLYAAFAVNADQCESADDLAALCGMAPVTDQSGKMRRVYRRLRCDHFLRQTLHEWASESWKHSTWAKLYVRHHQAKDKPFHTIIRCLAVKWIRILFILWKQQQPYDESKYRAKKSRFSMTFFL